jgi:hypothetical protein
MSSKALQVEMGKRERERGEREERVEGAFIPPHTEKSHYSSKTRNIRGKPGNSGKSGDSGINPDTPSFQGQHPRKCPRERVCAKVSIIGFVMATRAPVRLLEDTFPVLLYSTTFLGLKYKNIKQISLLRNLLYDHFLFV